MYLIFLGAPGAGKGTQADLVGKAMGLVHIASGDLFRQARDRGDELGQKVKSFMEKGALVPDEITIKLILNHLAGFKPDQGFILDGFPRTLEQARALDEALAKSKKSLDRVVYIKVVPDEMIDRLGGRLTCKKCQAPYHAVNSPPKVKGICNKCGGELYQREDDKPETIKKRLEVYLAQTAPLIDYYKKSGKLLEVNGSKKMDAVTREILASLKGAGKAAKPAPKR